jgi:hypothetical protein
MARKRAWMVTRKHGEPRYYPSFNEAQKAIRADLSVLHDILAPYDSRVPEAIAELRSQVDYLSDATCRAPQAGTVISGVVDPYTGMKYHATITWVGEA